MAACDIELFRPMTMPPGRRMVGAGGAFIGSPGVSGVVVCTLSDQPIRGSWSLCPLERETGGVTDPIGTTPVRSG